jgi:hypothetical protein
MEITGKVIDILQLQSGVSRSGNPWQQLTFVIETIEQYPKKVAIDLFGEQRIRDNQVAVGDVVTASFDIESREFNGRYYTSVRAWKVENTSRPRQATAPAPDPNPVVQAYEQANGYANQPMPGYQPPQPGYQQSPQSLFGNQQ